MPNGDREHKRKQDAWAREQARHEELRVFGQDVFDQQGNLKPDALNAYRQVQQRVKQQAAVQTGPKTEPIVPPSIPVPEPLPPWQTPWLQQEVPPIIDELPSAFPGTIGPMAQTIGPMAQVASQVPGVASQIPGLAADFVGWLGRQGQPADPGYRGWQARRDPALPPPPPAGELPAPGEEALTRESVKKMYGAALPFWGWATSPFTKEERPGLGEVAEKLVGGFTEMAERLQRPAVAQVLGKQPDLPFDLLSDPWIGNERVKQLADQYFEKLVADKGGSDKISTLDRTRARFRANELAYKQAIGEGAVSPFQLTTGDIALDPLNVALAGTGGAGITLGASARIAAKEAAKEAAKKLAREAAEAAAARAARESQIVAQTLATTPSQVRRPVAGLFPTPPKPPISPVQAPLDPDVMARTAQQLEFPPALDPYPRFMPDQPLSRNLGVQSQFPEQGVLPGMLEETAERIGMDPSIRVPGMLEEIAGLDPMEQATRDQLQRWISGTNVPYPREVFRPQKALIPPGKTPASRFGVQAARQEEVRKAIPGVERDAAVALADTPIRPPGQIDPVISAPVPGNRFLASFRSLDEIVPEVAFEANPFFRTVVAGLGLDPSRAAKSAAAKLMVAYVRQKSSTEELIETTVAAALDYHTRWFGKLGEVGQLASKRRLDEPVRIRPNGTAGNTGAIWNDVFANPDKFKTKLTDREIAYIDDYRAVIEEADNLRVSHSLPSLDRSASKPDGWFYIPRIVEEIKGASVRPGRTKPHLERFYDDAADGVAAGIKYLNSPRETLKLHLKTTYNEISQSQLSDAMEKLLISPSEFIPSNITSAYASAADALRAAKDGLKGIRAGAATAAERKALAAERKLARDRVEEAKRVYGPARIKYQEASRIARQKTTAPGNIFGLDQGEINIRLWKNKFLPEEQVQELEKVLGTFAPEANINVWRQIATGLGKGLDQLAGHIRLLSATFDLGAPFIHGLPPLARHPIIWTGAFMRSFAAFFNPQVLAGYFRKNQNIIHEMNRYYVPSGDVELFTVLLPGRGLRVSDAAKRVLGKVGADRLNTELAQQFGGQARNFAAVVGGQTLGRFQSAYNMLLLQIRTEMWRALKNSSRFRGKEDEMAGYIRNMTGGLDTKALGVGPGQRRAESFWFAFSPRLLRSTIALVSDAINATVRTPLGAVGVVTKPTAKQMASFEAVAAWLAVAHAAYIATGVALDKTPQEIAEGLNPLNGKKYLSHNINGDWVGVGGQVRAITQLLSTLVASVGEIEGPRGRERQIKDLIKPDIYENPLVQFLMARAAVGGRMLGATVEGLSGGKFDALPYAHVDGPVDILKHIGKSALPFTVQGKLEGEGAAAQTAGFMGLRTSPETPGEKKQKLVSVVGKEEGLADQATNQEVLNINGYSKGTEWSKELLNERALDAPWYEQSPKVKLAVMARSDFEEYDRSSKEMAKEMNPGQAAIQKRIDDRETDRKEWMVKTLNRSYEDQPEHPWALFVDKYGAYIEAHHEAQAIDYEKMYADFPDSKTMFGIARDVQSALLYEDDEEVVREKLGSYIPLKDDDGEMNWNEYDRRIDWLKRGYSEQYLRDVKEVSRASLHPIERTYLEDRQYIKDSGYWDVAEGLAEYYGLTKELNTYNALEKTIDKIEFKEENPDFSTKVMGTKNLSRQKRMLRRSDDRLEKIIVEHTSGIKPISEYRPSGSIPYRKQFIP